jgi:hypothetical protein
MLLGEIQGLTLLLILGVGVGLVLFKLFYNPKSEKTLTTSDALNDLEDWNQSMGSVKNLEMEIESILKYVYEQDSNSFDTKFFKFKYIEIIKKMYQDGIKNGNNHSDIILEIEMFFGYQMYQDLDDIDFESLLMSLRVLPIEQDDEETDVEKIRRPSIPQNIKDKVWNRDDGKCVQCGSNEKIEFDHIIPFSKGGSNTYRNLQILCEKCNRTKSDKIG